MSKSLLKNSLILLCATFAVSSCGWVDSTGNNNSSGAALLGSPASNTGASISSDPVNLSQTRIVQLLEQNSVRITPGNAIGQNAEFNWSTSNISAETNTTCERVSDFDSSSAANSLQNACSVDTNCGLNFQSVLDDRGRRVFNISVPPLQAPVALDYQLRATEINGRTFTENYTFCAIPINEPPVARDDTFTIVRGQTFVIRGNDVITLLSNDSDDVDTSNQPLRVNPTPVIAPRLASNFSLASDGGFIYTAPLSADGATNRDRFVYEITDGLHTVQATVTLRIIGSNQSPIRIGDIPDLQLSIGETLDTNNAELDFSMFFRDADGSPLRFMATQGSLPNSGNLRLDVNGRLSGRVEAADTGNYIVTIIATDGNLSATGSFRLSLGATAINAASNSNPVIESVSTVLVNVGSPISQQIIASDSDGDSLIYRLSDNSPSFLSIDSSSGFISGSTQTPGVYPVTAIASDSFSSSSTMFLVRVLPVNNQAPFVDDISNIVVNRTFDYDVSVFFEDPDGDSMTFTAENLPAGITISSDGVISGTPDENNTGRHFIVVTADDGNRGMASDGFLLNIR